MSDMLQLVVEIRINSSNATLAAAPVERPNPDDKLKHIGH